MIKITEKQMVIKGYIWHIKYKTFFFLLRKILVQTIPLDSDIPSSDKLYWCPVRLLYHIIFILFNSNREQLLNIPEHPPPSPLTPRVIAGCIPSFSFLCLFFCPLSFVSSVLIKITTFDYTCGIFKL